MFNFCSGLFHWLRTITRFRYPYGCGHGTTGATTSLGNPPIRSNRSATCFRFTRNCVPYSMCWYWQPPHRPKYGHGAVTRSGDASITRNNRARAKFFFTSISSASTVSPTSVNATNTTKSSRRPTPSPPNAMSVIVNWTV